MGLNDIIDRLRQSGHKVTPQRITIIKIVLESNELLSPSELYHKARLVNPDVGEVTVYRTLDILSELGLVCMVHTEQNTHSYVSRPQEHHYHLICSECGKVINLTGCVIDDLQKKLETETGFTIHDHRLDLYGKCSGCQLKAKQLS